eukprot:1462822-Prymnesium_polylepis.1
MRVILKWGCERAPNSQGAAPPWRGANSLGDDLSIIAGDDDAMKDGRQQAPDGGSLPDPYPYGCICYLMGQRLASQSLFFGVAR